MTKHCNAMIDTLQKRWKWLILVLWWKLFALSSLSPLPLNIFSETIQQGKVNSSRNSRGVLYSLDSLTDNKPKLTNQAIKIWFHLGRRQSLYFPVRSCSHFQVRANSASEANKAKIKAGRVAPGPKRKTWSSCQRTTWKHLNTTIFNNS